MATTLGCQDELIYTLIGPRNTNYCTIHPENVSKHKPIQHVRTIVTVQSHLIYTPMSSMYVY